MERIAMAALAGSAALGYFSIAGVVAPRIKMPGANSRLVLVIRGAAIAFFIGCGMTHVHILLHTLGYGGAPQAVETHEFVFHSAQAIGAWLFVLGAVLRLELHIVPSQTKQDLEVQRRLADEAQEIACHDEMTGLVRRWCFDEGLDRQVKQSLRSGRAGALIMVDVDGLKAVNDTSGHLAGDHIIRNVASQMLSTLRTTDTAARVGGDEFAIILPEVDMATAEAIADRLVAVAHTPALGGVPQTSISVGLVEIDGSRCPTELIEHADAALYAAKRAGGDRSVSSSLPLIRIA